MRLPLVAATAAALLVVGVGGTGAQDAAGKKQIEGTWELVGVTRGGKDRPADKEKTTITFAAGTMTMKGLSKDGGEKQKTAKYAVNTTKTPNWIDIDGDDGEGRKEKVLGLYEVKGDTLRLVLGRPEGDRPASLESKEGDKSTVARLKRVK
jgi:uncharacterized protein (TIGR03067 family)